MSLKEFIDEYLFYVVGHIFMGTGLWQIHIGLLWIYIGVVLSLGAVIHERGLDD